MEFGARLITTLPVAPMYFLHVLPLNIVPIGLGIASYLGWKNHSKKRIHKVLVIGFVFLATMFWEVICWGLLAVFLAFLGDASFS